MDPLPSPVITPSLELKAGIASSRSLAGTLHLGWDVRWVDGGRCSCMVCSTVCMVGILIARRFAGQVSTLPVLFTFRHGLVIVLISSSRPLSFLPIAAFIFSRL